MAAAPADWHRQTPEDSRRIAEPLLPGRGVKIAPRRLLYYPAGPAKSKPGLLNFEYPYGTTGAELEAQENLMADRRLYSTSAAQFP